MLSTIIGLAIGLTAGYLRMVDAIVMRIMDGMMAIPAIMLAIALIAFLLGIVVADAQDDLVAEGLHARLHKPALVIE